MQTKIKSKIASSGNIYIQHCVYNIQHAPAVQQSWNTRITNTCQLSVCQGQYQSLNDNTLWAYPNKISYFNGIYFMSGKEYVLFMLWIKCLPLTLPSVLNKAHFLTPTSNFEKAKRKAKMKHYCTGKSRLSALGLTSPRGFLEIYIKKKSLVQSAHTTILMKLTALNIFNIILIYDMGSLKILRMWAVIRLFILKSLIILCGRGNQ